MPPAASPVHPSVVGILTDDANPAVSMMKVDKAPSESYADIGGLEKQIQEIKEAVELPLTHPELYSDIGIRPPKGVILYGPPGTGKTLLAKAVANQTSATFLRIVGSELIQKYLGDGPKLVREIFRLADENAPSIVFIDEIDAVGTKRYDTTSGGEREIQRTMLELLNQLDGFDERGDVKVIMATNRWVGDAGCGGKRVGVCVCGVCVCGVCVGGGGLFRSRCSPSSIFLFLSLARRPRDSTPARPHPTPPHTIPHHTIPHHTIPHHTTPYHTTPYHAMPPQPATGLSRSTQPSSGQAASTAKSSSPTRQRRRRGRSSPSTSTGCLWPRVWT